MSNFRQENETGRKIRLAGYLAAREIAGPLIGTKGSSPCLFMEQEINLCTY